MLAIQCVHIYFILCIHAYRIMDTVYKPNVMFCELSYFYLYLFGDFLCSLTMFLE